MPASAAATGDDDEDLALPSSNPPLAQISDSDMDIDNGDDEEEEDPEEEIGGRDNDDDDDDDDDDEEIKVEEEEVDQRRNDSRQHTVSVRQLGSHSTREMSELKEDSVNNFKWCGPLDELHKEKSCVNYADSRSPKLSKHLVFAQKNGTLECAVNKTDADAHTIKNRKGCSEAFGNSKTHLGNSSEALAVETAHPFVITGIEVDAVLSKRNCLGQGANIVMGSKEEHKPVDVKSEDTKEQKASRFSRLVASGTRARSISPSTELRDGNKRAAVICDFFSKGWCIRGSSCRFLHTTNKADNISQQSGVDEVATREDPFDEGVRNILETPKFPHFPDPVASSTGKEATFSSHFSPERLPPLEHKENQWLHQLDDKHKLSPRQREGIPRNANQFSSSKDDPGFSSSFKNVGIENFRQHWPGTDYGSYSSLINRGSLFSFSSTFDLSLLGSQKLPDGDYASRSSSLLQSASAFSGSEPESLSLAGVPGDRLRLAEHKTKISSNDWEPSVPFRPSFFITPEMISSAGSKYDPLRDSFDVPNIGDKSLEFSFFSLGASISNTSQQPIYDSLSNQNFGTEFNGEKSAISSHDKPHGILLDKNCSTPGKDSFTTATVSGGAGTTDGENGSALKEESASGIGYDKVNRVTNKIDRDARPQIGVLRHKKDLKADSVRQNNDMEVDQKIGEDVEKESKVLRHFRAALIDFVKDMLKPTWREGHLSKDAHNTIVKKTVEKVLSTLQPHQIPATVESIKQYLSSSQPKMAKLVEGYISKHGKS